MEERIKWLEERVRSLEQAMKRVEQKVWPFWEPDDKKQQPVEFDVTPTGTPIWCDDYSGLSG